jgi:hypothetical protein
MNAAYDDLATQFARLIAARLAELEIVLSSDKPLPQLDVADLIESAQVLGADRLLSVLQRITNGDAEPSALRTEHTFLCKELKLLQTVLPTGEVTRRAAPPVEAPADEVPPAEPVEA